MKLFRRHSEGYGNIYTPHAGSMIIQVQREHGLANRTIILTQRQVQFLKSLTSRKWLVFVAIFVGTWAWLVTDRVQALVAQRAAPSAAQERARVDSLAHQLGEMQQRYDQLSKMLGSQHGAPVQTP